MVTPEYFRTFGIPILKGRSFTEQDGAGGLPVAIVNETFVKKYLANVDPLTQIVVVQQLRLGTLGPPIEWHIVGLAKPLAINTHYRAHWRRSREHGQQYCGGRPIRRFRFALGPGEDDGPDRG